MRKCLAFCDPEILGLNETMKDAGIYRRDAVVAYFAKALTKLCRVEELPTPRFGKTISIMVPEGNPFIDMYQQQRAYVIRVALLWMLEQQLPSAENVSEFVEGLARN
jgi:hypothetical protein